MIIIATFMTGGFSTPKFQNHYSIVLCFMTRRCFYAFFRFAGVKEQAGGRRGFISLSALPDRIITLPVVYPAYFQTVDETVYK